MTYDGNQRLTGVDMSQTGNTVASSTMTYDADSELTNVAYYTNTSDTGTPLAAYHFDYNAAGAVTDEYSRKDSDSTSLQGTYEAGDSNWAKTSYSYDADAQLTGATYSSNYVSAPTSFSAAYDPNGNRTSTGDTSATDRVLFDGTFYYTYDAAGNRTAQYKITSGSDHSLGTQSSPNSEAADITIYTWNNANEMTAAAHFNTAADWHDGYYQTSGEYTISYAYDAFGRMVTRTAATGYNPSEPVGTITDFEFLHVTTENFVYWGQNNVLVLDGNGQVIDRNLTGLAPIKCSPPRKCWPSSPARRRWAPSTGS